MDKRKEEIKELKSKIEVFRKEIKPLDKRKSKLQDQLDLEENQKLIGKCFRYRNSYGSGDKWWLYKKIVEAGNWDVTVLSAQDDGDGRVEIKREAHSANGYKNKGYGDTEISLEEFNESFNEIFEKLKK